MTWQKWALVTIYVITLLGTIARIGQPRQPNTPADATAALIFTGALILLVVTA